MRRSRAELDYEPAHINVVPLVDVMFFLVLFFVVTSAFVNETGIEIDAPAARTATLPENGNIVLAVGRDEAILIDGQRVDFRLVKSTIERLVLENPGSTVIIAADGEVRTRRLVEVLDQVRLAGVTDAAIAAREDDPAR